MFKILLIQYAISHKEILFDIILIFSNKAERFIRKVNEKKMLKIITIYFLLHLVLFVLLFHMLFVNPLGTVLLFVFS